MIERSNALNEIYQTYDSEMNRQHSIDCINPAQFLTSMPPVSAIDPRIKSTKEDSESAYLNASILNFNCILPLILLDMLVCRMLCLIV